MRYAVPLRRLAGTVDWDGTRVIEVTDDTLGSPGRVGLWTKADSATEFDDLTVTAPRGGAP
jgi:hypothetical protein